MISFSTGYVVCFCLITNWSDSPSQDQATQTIEKLGGAFCRLRIGSIIEVNLDGTDATDADLENLSCLHHLRILSLARTKVTGEGLRHLAPLRELRSLDLTWTGITDAGLKELGRLNKLEALDLSLTKI